VSLNYVHFSVHLTFHCIDFIKTFIKTKITFSLFNFIQVTKGSTCYYDEFFYSHYDSVALFYPKMLKMVEGYRPLQLQPSCVFILQLTSSF